MADTETVARISGCWALVPALLTVAVLSGCSGVPYAPGPTFETVSGTHDGSAIRAAGR